MRQAFMVHVNWAGSAFVKTLEFYAQQGGFAQDWGKAWYPVVASSIEEAREKASVVVPAMKTLECRSSERS